MSGKKDDYVNLLKVAIGNFKENLSKECFKSVSMLKHVFGQEFKLAMLYKSDKLFNKGGTHKWLQYVKKEIGNIKGADDGGTFESAKNELCELFDIGPSLTTKIKLTDDAAIKQCEEEIIALRSKIRNLKE